MSRVDLVKMEHSKEQEVERTGQEAADVRGKHADAQKRSVLSLPSETALGRAR